MDTFSQYKENRCNDETFLGGPFFKLAYKELYPNNKNIKTIIGHDRLEADDCIAIATKHVLEKDKDAHDYIITSDMDYLQLLNERTHIYNLKYKMLTESKNAFECAEKTCSVRLLQVINLIIYLVFLENVVLKLLRNYFQTKMNLLKN